MLLNSGGGDQEVKIVGSGSPYFLEDLQPKGGGGGVGQDPSDPLPVHSPG